jgi:butyryl-CoA dehydrogenase
MIIDTIFKMGDDFMYPLFQEMDAAPPVYQDGMARVHPAVRNYMREFGRGGWINAALSYEMGGQQIPNMINYLVTFITGAANYSLSVYPMLTSGAANLLVNFASPDLQQKYLDKMFAGEWQGTMALTEPDAGSSLSDIRTQAEETGEDYYRIKGKKIFISAGDTDAVDNTVHLMLARIKGAPAGVKGISLFVVPKYRYTADGGLEFNDLHCDGIEHKMGYKGSPICQLTMGEDNDCHGWLVGEANKGLSYMFQMMNEERINVGIAATAKATAAYYASLEYCRQRLQGRKIKDKNPSSPQVPIIEHADIKRLLLFQRAIAEGALSLCLQASKYMDMAKAGIDQENNELLLDFLVPIVKTYPAEMGILSTSAAIQCLGGYGYCRDFPVEQYFRDVRIDTLHEGTTGIQGQDLLGRKVKMKNGRVYQLFLEEVRRTIAEAQTISQLQPYADKLTRAVKLLSNTTEQLLAINDAEEALADATLYLEMMGIVTVAWQWLMQAQVAGKALETAELASDKNFYEGKIYTCKYFFRYELPRIEALAQTLLDGDRLTVSAQTPIFED